MHSGDAQISFKTGAPLMGLSIDCTTINKEKTNYKPCSHSPAMETKVCLAIKRNTVQMNGECETAQIGCLIKFCGRQTG